MKENQQRVILIGIDGAAWDLIDKFVEQGHLPAFAQLKAEGSWGTLKSTIPCYSPLAWNSIFTGVDPGKHGIVGFVKHEYNSADLKPLNSMDRKFPALWNYANYHEINSVFVNIPFAYPLETADGVFVCGLGVPFENCEYTYPSDLKEYIKQNFPDYKIDYDEKLVSNRKNKESFARECLRILDSKLSFASELFAKESCQLFTTVIRATDTFQHFCWHDEELIREVYKKIDKFLSFVKGNMKGSDTLMIVSDHGFSELKQMIYLVNFLLQEGYMVSKKDKKLREGISLDFINKIILSLGGTRLLSTLKRNSWIRKIFFRFFPVGKFSYLNSVDWDSSLVSYAEGSGGILHINPRLKSDEKNLSSFLAELKKKALKLRD
ncbi:alkaline phosphatase family protein, partial [Candidatus Pacearchaeota archaeon]|nr:alkaline phosphatase family protein [Candidatus Pacearchaeota archaeon]